ncbi:PAS domain S-box-containing protein [Palleronia marisminoris]|uniref:PAS fold protein n=1 Tax=Palleronia marisminoris TaxID=315423 RepID=A0A1Y5TIE8_9RHOB|nr:PAS domain-containing protein [Palleronia marisminoris]SFH39876.1 PAS domain S-box-containing protein [Palleronia marisminoris]SLN64801.1 PAS fold protein [Palleronia marisminoris]
MRLPRQAYAGYDEEWLIDDLAGCTPVVTLGFLRRSPHAVKLVDRNGSILYLNENAMAFYGVEAVDEAVGKLWWDLVRPQLRHTLRNVVTRAGLGENVRVTVDRQDAQGRDFSTEIVATPVRCRAMSVSKLLVVSPIISTDGKIGG